MKLRMLLAFVTLSFAVTVVAAAPPVALVEDGRPACAIVIAKDARKSARFGAFELQWHIKKMTGAEIPIVSATEAVHGIPVYVGESDALKDVIGSALEGFKTQEYVVSVQPDRIILAGMDADDKGECAYNMDDPLKMSGLPDMWDSNGSLYAVYDFLERTCGVRWFNQTESGTFIPGTKSLSVPCGELRRRPAFTCRQVNPPYGPSGYDGDVSLWKRDSPELKEWDALAYAGLHEKYPNAGQYNAARGNLTTLFLLRSRDGGDRANCNHSFYGYYDRFWQKNPNNPAVFVEKRSDYFAKGYPADATPPQLCYTDPGLIRQAAQDAADYYDGKKTGRDLELPWVILPNPFPVEPMDNSEFCKCENCARFFQKPKAPEAVFSTGADSDYFFNFVNEVCKELHKTHPDKGVISLAYASHARVPSFPLDPSVNIHYCFTADRTPYDLLGYNNELANLAAWAAEKKDSGRPLGLYLYYCFPLLGAIQGNCHCFPGFFAHTIAKQMKLWHQYGIYGMTYDGFGQEVEAYVTFRLMNDPSLDVDVLLDEYFARLYGNAAEPMKKLYSRIEETYCDPASYVQKGDADPKHAGGKGTMETSWGMLGTEERMAEFGGLMESAEKLAQTDMEKLRVALFKKAIWEYMTTGAAQYRQMKKAAIPSLAAPAIQDARGDANSADWSKAIALGGTWFKTGTDERSNKKLSGRICHDGKFLYLELSDACNTAKLVTSAEVCPYDDWEIFVAGQRALPYRQFMIGPTGQLYLLSYGEVNWRMGVPITDAGIKAVSDVSAKDRWVLRVTIPLASLTAQGVAADGEFYLNVVRVSSPQVTGRWPLEIDTWVSFTRVLEVQRLAEITLAR